MAEGGVSLLVGTCSRALEPDSVRGVGLRVHPGASAVTVLVPVATSRASIANLRENPRMALTFCRVIDMRTFQVKGALREIRDADDGDHALALRYRDAFAESLAEIGQHREITRRITVWPALALDLEIELIFAQSPGPAAGTRYEPRA